MRPFKMIVLIASLIITITLFGTADGTVRPVATKVSGGEDHTLILNENNMVFACGANGNAAEGYYGVLGVNDLSVTLFEPIPVPVHGPNDVNYLEDISDIDAGRGHSLALDVNKNVWSWGYNDAGQLGIDSNDPCATPVKVHCGDMNTTSGFLEDIIGITAGRSGHHSLAVDSNNLVWAWGYNYYGQLGNGKNGWDEAEFTPVQVEGGQMDTERLENIIAVSAGEMHSMALDDVNGGVWTFGDNDYGELGDDQDSYPHSDTPVHVLSGQQDPNDENSHLENIVAISAGWDHCMALEKYEAYDALKAFSDPNYGGPDPNYQGRVYAWGRNEDGRLGDGTETNRYTPVIVKSGQQDPDNDNSYLTGIAAVSAGDDHSMALDVNGFVYTWGDNEFGQLGDGSNDSNTTPVKVHCGDMNTASGYLEDIVAISAGYWHCVAIDEDGTIWTWGKGESGRLGLGDIENKLTPHYLPVVCNLSQGTSFFPGYFRIKDAIDNADDGDLIEASVGTFREDIDFSTKSLTLRSKDPGNPDTVENTIIYGSGETGTAAIACNDNAGLTLAGLTIINGDYGYYGIYCDSSSAEITNCIIKDNAGYGAVYATDDSSVKITDTSILGNSSSAGVDSNDSSLTLANCLIQGNDNVGVNCEGENKTDITMTGCTVIDNGTYYQDHSITVDDCNLVLTDCNIIGNHVDGIYSYDSDLTVRNCLIDKNGGDGIYNQYPSNTLITNNIIRRNSDKGIDFGEYCIEDDVKIKNNWIHNNTGDGIYIYDADPAVIIRNNTIFDNGGFGVVVTYTGSVDVSNCILWGNNDGGTQLSNCTATYSCIENGGTGIGNISSDPCFIDPTDPNDYHLDPNSPCVDKGDTGPNYDVELDIDGEVREWDGDDSGNDEVDMGGDEYYWSPADYNKDEIVNFLDYAIFANPWQSENENVSLDDDSDVDMVDLYHFRKDWLWRAGWTIGYACGYKGRGTDGGFEKSAQVEQLVEKQVEAEIDEDAIKDILECLEDMWLNGDLKDTMTEERYIEFRKHLENLLNP